MTVAETVDAKRSPRTQFTTRPSTVTRNVARSSVCDRCVSIVTVRANAQTVTHSGADKGGRGQGCSTGYLYWYWYLELKYWYLYLYLRHGYWYWYLRLNVIVMCRLSVRQFV